MNWMADDKWRMKDSGCSNGMRASREDRDLKPAHLQL